jgi:hypothetical protein
MVSSPDKPELCWWLITFPPDNFFPGILISNSKPTDTVDNVAHIVSRKSSVSQMFCFVHWWFRIKKQQHLSLDQPARLPIKQINSKNKNLLSESVVLTFQYTHRHKYRLTFRWYMLKFLGVLSYLTELCQPQRIFSFGMWQFVQWTEKGDAETVFSVKVGLTVTEVSLYPWRCEFDLCCVLEGTRKETVLQTATGSIWENVKAQFFKNMKIYLKCLLCSVCVLLGYHPTRHQSWLSLTILICHFKRILGL